jgi:hypothetical protein
MYRVHTGTYRYKSRKVCTWYILWTFSMYQYVPVVNDMYQVHHDTSTYFEVKVHVGMYPVHLGTMQYMSVWYHSIDVHGMYLVHTGMYSVHTFGQDSRCDWPPPAAASLRLA